MLRIAIATEIKYASISTTKTIDTRYHAKKRIGVGAIKVIKEASTSQGQWNVGVTLHNRIIISKRR